MTPHRAIWLIAGSAVLLAALVFLAREHRNAIPAEQRRTIHEMIEALKADPYADRPETQRAIAKAAEMAANGVLYSPEAFYAQGIAAIEARRFAEAEAALRKAIAMNPAWSWPFNALGILLANYSKNRTDEAEQAYRNAIRLDPGWSRPYSDLSILLRLSGRLPEAEKMSLEALRLAPNSVATRNNYGNLLVAQKKYPEAEEQYRKAIDLAPEHPKPYYNLACVCNHQNKKEEALLLLQKAVERNPALREDARRDPDFDSLRADPRFQNTVAPMHDGTRPEAKATPSPPQ